MYICVICFVYDIFNKVQTLGLARRRDDAPRTAPPESDAPGDRTNAEDAREETRTMSGAYDEVDLEDMEWRDDLKAYTYQCPCGDFFQITLEELRAGEDVAHCPSCSLVLLVIYDPDDLPGLEEDAANA